MHARCNIPYEHNIEAATFSFARINSAVIARFCKQCCVCIKSRGKKPNAKKVYIYEYEYIPKPRKNRFG